MSFSRPAFALCQRRFGRGRARVVEAVAPDFADGVKLFAATFAAGFLFVSILIG